MRNLYKKLIPLLMAFVLILGSVPPVPVFAAPGTSMSITTHASANNNYDVSLSFTPPSIPNLVRYKVTYENVTRGGVQSFETNNAASTITFTRNLDPGSLYTFKVYPISYTTDAQGNTVYHTSSESAGDFAALTNITVDAIGSGNSISVTFDVPRVKNADFFQQYKIYFATIGVANMDGNLEWTNMPETVDASSLKIENNKATYTYYNSAFKPGKLFAIKVEPVLNNNERDNISPTQIISNLGSFTFATDRTVDYHTGKAYIRPSLVINDNSLTNIDLIWDSLDKELLSSKLSSLDIYQYTPHNNVTDNILHLGNDFFSTTSVSIPKPDAPVTEFFMRAVYNDVSYKIKNKSYNLGNVTIESARIQYMQKEEAFAPYSPHIYDISHTGTTNASMAITWEGFLRNPLNAIEEEYEDTGKHFDKNITYDIYITDDPVNFSSMRKEHALSLLGTGIPVVKIDNKPYFKYNFANYYTNDGSGLVQKAFVQNKIYYIKIVASRGQETSIPAYGSYYIMPTDKIPVEPNILASPPLRIKVLNGAEVITENSITVEWDEQWIEIFKPGPSGKPEDGKWFSKIGISNGSLLYGSDTIKDSDNILLKNRVLKDDGTIDKLATFDKIKEALKAFFPESPTDPTNILVLRLADISGVSYKLHNAEYALVGDFGYTEYYDEISRAETTYQWENISPKKSGPITMEFTVTASHNPPVNTLKPGTPYAIFIRPFASFGSEERLASYPAYVTSTTLTGRDPVEINPVVPILEPVSSTDISVTVRFEYLDDLQYELRISDLYTAYSTEGTPITNEELLKNGIKKIDTATGKLYMEYTINGLFPETRYYLWIRSASGGKQSNWSNPIEMKTLELSAPEAPRGLGLASKLSVNTYNQEKKTDYLPSDKDYIIVEWLRINADIDLAPKDSESTGGGGDKTAAAEFLFNPAIKESYMVKFNELISSKLYYIRAKTRLTVSKNGILSERAYSYIVEISLEPDFKDALSIEVPLSAEIKEGSIYKESEWVSVQLFSEKSDSEYDGDKDPNTYPLPHSDFEIIYDNKTSTLTYRFRSNETGKDGKKDNLVDERFISRLVSNKTFVYEIDISKYNHISPLNRQVEFPYTIISAFNERKISLKIKADNFTVTFQPGSFNTTEVNALTGLNKNAKVHIHLNQNPFGIPLTDNYISSPQKLSTTVASQQKAVNIINYAKPVMINLSLSGKFIENATNLGAYVIDENTGGWQRLPASYDIVSKSLNASSYKAATYSAIGIVTPGAVTGETLNQLYRVNSKLVIADMGVYNENTALHANQFNQITAAVLKGSSTVYMNEPLSQENYDALGKGKLLVSGSGVSREAGISALVRLYEIKAKRAVTGYPSLNETGYQDISGADEKYRVPLLKAVDLGFYRETYAKPKNIMTFGDLMHILDIILSY